MTTHELTARSMAAAAGDLGSGNLENAVLAHLTGTDAITAARLAGTSAERLARAATRYRTAGRAALAPAPSGWAQVNLKFTDYAAAETVFRAGLSPVMQEPWWFVRKAPCWRLRYRLPDESAAMPNDLHAALDAMIADGALGQWTQAPYEPETAAFGGREGLAAVHAIHVADAVGLFTYLDAAAADRACDGLGRSVASLMVLSHLMRAAGVEWNEQGDVWARVQAQRPPARATDEQIAKLAAKARTALAADLTHLIADEPRFSGLSTWATGMQNAGEQLAAVVREGRLQAGVRTVLARVVAFCWNRAGFTTDQQAVWARAARLAILE
ncbi:thiopeptide-type bacteriocin biosynthesis protein [Myceligenerans indicum]|uniref:Bacteriocin biosynthesis protein n=1 Tax=Myceligenerans indicum TaxID=2593663 RepID=A0ABS1LLI2_9MICO|nr:thiopeptide-type bacteriocin biosynthesis protein [Myceligenerans indicum]MBL0886903.1 bacteriocin biosynthesis protein [Myceligenerans indicum]